MLTKGAIANWCALNRIRFIAPQQPRIFSAIRTRLWDVPSGLLPVSGLSSIMIDAWQLLYKIELLLSRGFNKLREPRPGGGTLKDAPR